jgi:hypothetical protein
VALSVEIYRAPDCSIIGVEFPLPQRMRDQRHLVATLAILLDPKITPTPGRDAESRQKIRGNLHALEAFGFTHARHIERSERVSCEVRERPAYAQVGEIAAREIRRTDEHDPLRLRQRQRPQQHRVAHAKHRGVCANAKCESEHGDQGEARMLAQRARRVAQVTRELLEPYERTLLATALLDLLAPTEFPLRRVTCLLGRHPIRHVILGALIQMKPHLLGHLAVEFFFAEECAEFGEERMHRIDRYSARNAIMGFTFVARRAGR